MKRISIFTVLPLVLGFLLSASAKAEPVRRPHIEVEFVSSVTEINPGTPFWVGIRFKPDPGWHVYWKYAGDSGIAPKLTWHLPRAFSAGDIMWPRPERLPLAHLVNYGYASEVILPVQVTPAQDLKNGIPVGFGVSADWLVCEEECIPGDAQFTMELPVSAAPAPAHTTWHEKIEKMRSLVPHSMNVAQDLGMRADINGANYELSWEVPGDVPLSHYEVIFFPSRARQIENAPPQRLVVDQKSRVAKLTLKRAKVSERPVSELKGVLVTPQGWGKHIVNDAVEFSIPVEGVPMVAEVATPPIMPAAARNAEPQHASFFLAIGLALLGGLMLNLMPCVFPVLSIKILGFVKQSDKHPRAVRIHGGLFGAGVLVSFWILAGILLITRASGSGIGWGFQLQSPSFVLVLCFTIFVLALNLMGLFEFGSELQNVAGKIKVKDGYVGSFMSGVLATVLATPCTAPFMGTALAAALTVPPLQSFAIFTALGVGMALPFTLITWFPGLMKFVPRPGAWMETFKHLVAFPLFATVIWLLWVLSLQLGPNSTIGLLSALLLVYFGFWIFGRFGNTSQPARKRFWAKGATFACLCLAVFLAWPRATEPPHALNDGMVVHDSYGLEWEVFSAKRLESLLREERNVYIDFTAAWCISCQVNKALVFGSEEVRKLLEEKEVVLLKADWTSKDSAIAEALRSYGRDGVPLNVLYRAGDRATPVIFPALLTAGLVAEELKKLP